MALTSTAFDFVRDLVQRESAIVLTPGKEYLVEARLLPLARKQGSIDVSDFVDHLRSRPDRAAQQLVVEALTTNETSWFRDSEPFSLLSSTLVPDVLRSRSDDRCLRIWSAACSSGQEPYSIAMLLGDQLRSAGWTCQIVGTDISEAMLERAREGRYSQLEMNRGMPAPMLVRHFQRAGAEWQVSAEIRRMVAYRKLNLAAPLPVLPSFDIVFLRNVLIYFDTATKRSILQRVRGVMRPESYLVLGAAETTLGIDESWERVALGRTSVHRPGPTPGGNQQRGW
jgi:chemotaxis protein methyltransferase CheR